MISSVMQTTPDAERDEYIRVMGPELGQVCHELQNDFGWLVHKWLEHKELYRRGQERIDLLNSVASNFFYFLNKLLFEDAMLHLCRLTDPPRSCGKNTLTVRRLAELVSEPTLKNVVQTKADHAKNSCDFARKWRNQRLAHTDLETLRTGHAAILPSVNASNIEDAMNAISDVIGSVEAHYGRPHSITISDPWGSKSLVGYLKHSKKLRDQEMAGWRSLVKAAAKAGEPEDVDSLKTGSGIQHSK